MNGRLWAGVLLVLGIVLSGCDSATAPSPPDSILPAGVARVAWLPHHDGLQYCIRVIPSRLAPPKSRYVYVHSFSAYITTTKRNRPALLGIHGRYPGWDTPGTTIYQQPFTNTNTVWVEIDHEFLARPIDCIEIYGRTLIPSSYHSFRNHILLGYSYFHGTHGFRTVKLFPIRWGSYLPQYSPRHRPRH